MLVKELIEILQSMPQDSIVILQKDSEGNGYSPLYDVDSDAIYVKETDWYGEVKSTQWTADEAGMEEKMWTIEKVISPACVVLSPTN